MHTPAAAQSRTKQLIFSGILVTAGALVSLLTVYKLSVANAYRVFEVETATVSMPTDAASIARGAHLTGDVLACQSCHGTDLGGRVLMDNAQAVITAPNLTLPKRDDETWTRTLRLGVDGEGRGLWVMPTRAHSIVNDADLGAIVASIRARPEVVRPLPQSHLRFWGNWAVATRQLRLVQTSQMRTQAPAVGTSPGDDEEYGRYLASLAGCAGCHGPGTPSAIGQAALINAASFARATTAQHTSWPQASLPVPVPQGGFARLTLLEFSALWRYFKNA